MDKRPAVITNMGAPMPLGRKLGLILRNNWLKIYHRTGLLRSPRRTRLLRGVPLPRSGEKRARLGLGRRCRILGIIRHVADDVVQRSVQFGGQLHRFYKRSMLELGPRLLDDFLGRSVGRRHSL